MRWLMDFSNWKGPEKLNDCYGNLPNCPGVYIISTEKEIHRLVGKDPLGILDIGETMSLKTRIIGFVRCAENAGKKGHMAGLRFNKIKLSDKFPLSELYIRWCVVETKEHAYSLEGNTLKKYLDKHYELPPLNYKFNWSEK